MKKIILSTILFALFIFDAQSQNSVLSQGVWYKFSIDTTGVFKINANFLQNLGIDIDAIDPNTIKVYGNGGRLLPENVSDFRYDDLQENAIHVEGAADGVFNEDDFILFYGRGPHSWNIDTTNNTVNHVQNIYTEKTFYFLTIDNVPGKRISQKESINESPLSVITNYDDYVFYEKEETNLLAVGRLWFGEDFSIDNNQSFSIPFTKAVTNSILSVKVAAVTQSSSTSSMSVNVNGM